MRLSLCDISFFLFRFVRLNSLICHLYAPEVKGPVISMKMLSVGGMACSYFFPLYDSDIDLHEELCGWDCFPSIPYLSGFVPFPSGYLAFGFPIFPFFVFQAPFLVPTESAPCKLINGVRGRLLCFWPRLFRFLLVSHTSSFVSNFPLPFDS